MIRNGMTRDTRDACARLTFAWAMIVQTLLAAQVVAAQAGGTASQEAAAEAAVAPTPAAAVPAQAASDAETAGRAREGQVWGGAQAEAVTDGPRVHRNARIFASVGAGGGLRMVQYNNLTQERYIPAFLQLRGGWFFSGEGDFQHGAALGVSANIMPDGSTVTGIDPFGQWTFSLAYIARYWFDDSWQAYGSLAASIALDDSAQLPGAELNIGMIYKPWAGLGGYLGLGASAFFANDVQPLLSGEAGVVIDWEVLP